MNKEETLALYAQGREAWNAWAEEMLAKRQVLEGAGEWAVNEIGHGENDATSDWLAAAGTDFMGHAFEEEASFSGFVFPSVAWFDSASFEGHARFDSASFKGNAWFGLAYQILSDFGRSLWLPLVWLGLSVGGFAWGFLARHQALAPTANLCMDGSGNALSAAIGLSLRNTLLFASAGLNDTMTQMHGCLWGWQPVVPGAKRLVPAIPDAVAFMGLAQNLLSAVLIFLFLLALRNHFRIK